MYETKIIVLSYKRDEIVLNKIITKCSLVKKRRLRGHIGTTIIVLALVDGGREIIDPHIKL